MFKEMVLGRSLINNKNRIGPKTVPWDTPDTTGDQYEDVLFISTDIVYIEIE